MRRNENAVQSIASQGRSGRERKKEEFGNGKQIDWLTHLSPVPDHRERRHAFNRSLNQPSIDIGNDKRVAESGGFHIRRQHFFKSFEPLPPLFPQNLNCLSANLIRFLTPFCADVIYEGSVIAFAFRLLDDEDDDEGDGIFRYAVYACASCMQQARLHLLLQRGW